MLKYQNHRPSIFQQSARDTGETVTFKSKLKVPFKIENVAKYSMSSKAMPKTNTTNSPKIFDDKLLGMIDDVKGTDHTDENNDLESS